MPEHPGWNDDDVRTAPAVKEVQGSNKREDALIIARTERIQLSSDHFTRLPGGHVALHFYQIVLMNIWMGVRVARSQDA